MIDYKSPEKINLCQGCRGSVEGPGQERQYYKTQWAPGTQGADGIS